jgi:GT2 family glycosyltransferase
MRNFEETIALIVFTRNRAHYMAGLLNNLESLETLPGTILVVDSSDSQETFNLIENSKSDFRNRMLYLHSNPGLPYQRNRGIREVLSNKEFQNVEILSFTDDDCRLHAGYFRYLIDSIRSNLVFCAITGIQTPMKLSKITLLRRFFYLDSRKSGAILKSGYTTPIRTTNGITEVEWMPGGCMNIKRSVLETIKFDEKLRMYGEDLKFSLILKLHGPLFVNTDMKYQHLEASQGKESFEDVISYTDGVRWHLAREFPEFIKKRYVMWSIIGSIIGSTFLKVRSDEHTKNKLIVMGHIKFLVRLFGRKSYVQENN